MAAGFERRRVDLGASVNAVTGPTPGMVARRVLTALALCAAFSLASISLIRARISSIC